MDSDGRSCDANARSGVETKSRRTWKHAVHIILKDIANEDSIELSTSLGIIR